jgi:hypothetical protein
MNDPFGSRWYRREILAGINELNLKMGTIMTELSQQQADINNAVTAVTGLLTDIGTQTSAILADVTALQALIAAGQPVSTTALDSAVAGIAAVDTALDSAVSSLSAVAVPAATGTTPTF